MRNTVFMSTLALALAVSGTAVAQSTTGATNPPSQDAAKQQQTAGQPSVLTVDKVKQDLQKAGFTDVKVLQDAFLIQAKTKDGNPIMLTIGPHGMSALEMSNSSDATTGQARPDNSPAAAPAKPAQH